MNFLKLFLAALFALSSAFFATAKEHTDIIRKAAQRSTLNQSGTKPFHLQAVLAPSKSDASSAGRSGQIEIWWMSPTQWRRELRTPDFRQIQIVNGSQIWQKNEGDYFPEWLRELAVALVNPVPDVAQAIKDADDGDTKHLMGNTYFSWTILSSNGITQKGMGGSVAITDKTGLLFHAGGSGWGGIYSDYQNFHGRMIARTVGCCTPEVKANIVSLAELTNPPPSLFSTDTPGGPLLNVQNLDEPALRTNLQSPEPSAWPPLKDGPLEGALTTKIVVDQTGKVREVGVIVSDNPGLSDAAREQISALRFSPFLQNGVPLQVVSRFTVDFKTVRPVGVEAFDTAGHYFERGRAGGFPAAVGGGPYILRAIFQTSAAESKDGKTLQGEYVDTWKNAEEWLREAKLGKSHFAHAQRRGTRYMSGNGEDKDLLRLLLHIMEPIPALDTFVESDWRMKSEILAGTRTVRVASGYEDPNGNLDPQHARAYWFDSNGLLLRAYFNGIDVRRASFDQFNGTKVAREIRAYKNGVLLLELKVTDLAIPTELPDAMFQASYHKWQRAFTDEVR